MYLDSKVTPATELPGPEQSTYRYPFASAPDIIRSAEKDVYFQGVLLDYLESVLRRVCGPRYVQTRAHGTRALTKVLYLACTTLLGNRTLGEEYCNLTHVESGNLTLPLLSKRAVYILFAIILPYLGAMLMPHLRYITESVVRSSAGSTKPNGLLNQLHRFLHRVLVTHMDSLI